MVDGLQSRDFMVEKNDYNLACFRKVRDCLTFINLHMSCLDEGFNDVMVQYYVLIRVLMMSWIDMCEGYGLSLNSNQL